mmetsp:Transcript_58166/g.115451  ORF Transcript_58166/g.115451 Transcript_58166/m.115451 type:complete len:311 (+) Transcript_58166:819-1751(+)
MWEEAEEGILYELEDGKRSRAEMGRRWAQLELQAKEAEAQARAKAVRLGARKFNAILTHAGFPALGVDEEWEGFSAWAERQELMPGMKGLSKLDPDDYEDLYIEVYQTWCVSAAYVAFYRAQRLTIQQKLDERLEQSSVDEALSAEEQSKLTELERSLERITRLLAARGIVAAAGPAMPPAHSRLAPELDAAHLLEAGAPCADEQLTLDKLATTNPTSSISYPHAHAPAPPEAHQHESPTTYPTPSNPSLSSTHPAPSGNQHVSQLVDASQHANHSAKAQVVVPQAPSSLHTTQGMTALEQSINKLLELS